MGLEACGIARGRVPGAAVWPMALPETRMLLLSAALKLVAEIALMALLGQGVLALLAGARRHDNFFYRVLQVLTRPFTRLTRAITPRLVLDRHIPLATFALVLAWWLLATLGKVSLCLQAQLASPLCR